MIRTLLLAILTLALFIELVLTVGAFFVREPTFHTFSVSITPDTAYLGYLVAWFLLFVSLTCALALWQVWHNIPGYATLCYLLGFWWVGIGIGIYLAFGKPDNMLLDSLKGAFIVGLTYRYRQQYNT